ADGDNGVEQRLIEALRQLEQARIGTIHSFCADLLRERPVEAGVDPLFEVAPEDVARELFDRAFDRWLDLELENPSTGVRRILRRTSSRDEGPRRTLRSAAWMLTEWRDFSVPWRSEAFDRDREIDAILTEIEVLGSSARDGVPGDALTRSLAELETFSRETR